MIKMNVFATGQYLSVESLLDIAPHVIEAVKVKDIC